MKTLAFRSKDETPLSAATAALRAELTTIEPPEVSGPRIALFDLRTQRAELTETFQEGCAVHRAETSNNNAPLPSKLLYMEKQIASLNERIAIARVEADTARAKWIPSALRAMKPHLTKAEPAIEQAIVLLESAAAFHEIADDYNRAHNLSPYITPRSRRLYDLVANLKRFLGK